VPYLSKHRYLKSVRDVRASLKECMESDAPTIIGTPYEARAIIVPVGKFSVFFGEDHKKQIAETKRRFAQALTVLGGL